MGTPTVTPPPGPGHEPTPGWYPDAYGEHQLRWWDHEWGDRVADFGEESHHPPTGNPKDAPFWDGQQWRQRAYADYLAGDAIQTRVRRADTAHRKAPRTHRSPRRRRGRRQDWLANLAATCAVSFIIAMGGWIAVAALWHPATATADLTNPTPELHLVGAPGQRVAYTLNGITSIRGKWASPNGIYLELDGRSFTVASPSDETWSYEANVWQDVRISSHIVVPDVPVGTTLRGSLTGDLRYPAQSGSAGTFRIARIEIDVRVVLDVVTEDEADRLHADQQGLRPVVVTAAWVTALVSGLTFIGLAIALVRGGRRA